MGDVRWREEWSRIGIARMQATLLRATGHWPNNMPADAAHGLACFLWWVGAAPTTPPPCTTPGDTEGA